MNGKTGVKKKMKLWKKILLIIVAVLVLFIAGFCVFWKLAPDSMKDAILKEVSTWPIARKFIVYEIGDDLKEVQDTEFSEENITVNEEVYEKLNLTGYTNIALFGIDEREEEFDEGSRTDTIIIMSINNDTNAIRLASVYRDTYLRQTNSSGDQVYNKANAAYQNGGVEAAINMLNTNLDLNITDYAVINFSGLGKAIDEMGGITVKVSKEEQYYINYYLKNLRHVTDLKCEDLKKHGKKVKLSGAQAVAFCRIRYCTFTYQGVEYHDDLGRTARQRYIISKMVKKAKKLPIGELMKFAKNVLNMNTADKTYFKTSMSTEEILNLIPTMIDYNITGTKGFPFTVDFATLESCGSTVIPAGLEYNVSMLHRFLFDEQDYEVSSTVQEISDTIVSYTGIDRAMLKTEDEEKLSPSYEEPETETETVSETETEASE